MTAPAPAQTHEALHRTPGAKTPAQIGQETAPPTPPTPVTGQPDLPPLSRAPQQIEARPLRTLPDRFPVRSKEQILLAQRVTTTGTVRLITGALFSLNPGDWLLYRDQDLVDARRADELLHFYEPSGQSLSLSDEERSQLDSLLGVGATMTGPALLAAVARLGSIHIGDIVVEFSPSQKEELQRRARKRGVSAEEETRRVVEYLLQSFWTA